MSGARNADFKTSYQPLNYDTSQEDEDNLSPEDPSDILIHIVPQSSKKRWNHIEDLDTFFARIYQYHQQHGLICMILKDLLGLFQFVFIVSFAIFLSVFVNYEILFQNIKIGKVHLADIVIPYSEVIFFWYIKVALFLAVIFFVLRTIYVGMTFIHFCEIRNFYNTALGILDKDLENVTWDEVQRRVMEVQIEQRMCIHKESLTEIDIYHRILRFQNYFIAMVNKGVIPLKLKLPFIGEITYLTSGLRFNIDKILFTGPWAPFENNWHLRAEYKLAENKHRLATELSNKFFYFGLVNFLVFPFIFIWQLFRLMYHNSEMITKDPGALGLRRWSNYAQVYLRHFNELDHELHARLSRGYRPAVQYMNIFASPVLAIIAKNVAFSSCIIFAVCSFLTMYDEDVLMVQHMVLIISITFFVSNNIQKLIPDPNTVWCPELLMTRILAEAHYLPDMWKGKAHTNYVRNNFSMLFEYRASKLFEEAISSLMTPFMLCFVIRHHSLEIVDFLRNFTVDVVGVGDICSFAQMDIRKHGSITWQPYESELTQPMHIQEEDKVMRMDGGKTELSLLHFTLTNPKWKPPQESAIFLTAVKTQAQKDFNGLNTVQEENALFSSMNSMSYGVGHGTIGTSILRTPWMAAHQALPAFQTDDGRLAHLEGSRDCQSNGILGSVSQSLSNSGLIADPVLASRHDFVQSRPLDATALDMGVSTLYLHELHNRKRIRESRPDTVIRGNFQSTAHSSSQYYREQQRSRGRMSDEQSTSKDLQENTPLLRES